MKKWRIKLYDTRPYTVPADALSVEPVGDHVVATFSTGGDPVAVFVDPESIVAVEDDD